MKFLGSILLALAVLSSGRHITLEDVIDFEDNPAFWYHTKIGIPLANKIRKLEEENPSRIIGGSLVNLEEVPYQAGLIFRLPIGTSIAGGVLISQRRVLTAAHNFNDAVSSATKLTVVLYTVGTINVFIAVIRLDTEEFTLHENYNAATLRNDIAVINLPYYIAFSETAGPAYLPTESMEEEDFDGETTIVSGYGHTSSSGISIPILLNYAKLTVMANEECAKVFGSFIQPTNVCASGNANVCQGDSGGPLVVNRDIRTFLIGISSFGIGRCETGLPSVFTRITSYIDWIMERS